MTDQAAPTPPARFDVLAASRGDNPWTDSEPDAKRKAILDRYAKVCADVADNLTGWDTVTRMWNALGTFLDAMTDEGRICEPGTNQALTGAVYGLSDAHEENARLHAEVERLTAERDAARKAGAMASLHALASECMASADDLTASNDAADLRWRAAWLRTQADRIEVGAWTP